MIKNFILFIKNAKGPEQRFVDEAVMCTLELLINTSSSKPNTDIMKKVMLAGLRHLIKSDGVFALVREDEEFHATYVYSLWVICTPPLNHTQCLG